MSWFLKFFCSAGEVIKRRLCGLFMKLLTNLKKSHLSFQKHFEIVILIMGGH
jgi:hypothetical protein